MFCDELDFKASYSDVFSVQSFMNNEVVHIHFDPDSSLDVQIWYESTLGRHKASWIKQVSSTL